MKDKWEISGEVGKQFGAVRAAIEELFPLVQPLTFRSQAADSFGYFLPANLDGSSNGFLPERGQRLTIYRNGAREFCGRVTMRKFLFNNSGSGWQIEVKGGWQEIETLPLISDSSATYDIAAGNLRTAIIAILQKAIDAGAEIQIGNIAGMLDIFPLQFRSATIAATVRDLLRFSQDAMTYFDYSTAGFPTLNIARRATATQAMITLGSDSVTRCELSPDDSSAPDRVDFIYAVANAQGIVSEITESAGAVEPKNRRQVVTAPTGFAAFQARAIEQQQILKTASTLTWAGVLNADPNLAAYCTANSVPTFNAGPATYTDVNDHAFPTSTFTLNVPATVFSSPNDITGKYALVAGEWREWLTTLGITAVTATATAVFYTTGTGTTLPAWLADFPIPANMHMGYASGVPAGKWVIWVSINQNVTMISQSLPALTTYQDPGDYSLAAPPAGIAAYLLETLVNPPYDGQLDFDAYQDYARQLGSCINVSGGPSELETAQATTKEESISLLTGERVLRLGSSAAGSGLDLMSRFRRLSAK